MGSTSSKNKKQPTINHQRFQSIKILNDQQIQIQMRIVLDDYNTWKSNLRKINSFNKQNILIPLNHSFQKQGWCSQNTGISKEQLQNRITLDKHLSQQQMWYLLYTLVSTAKDFSYINKKVGDIRPHNIFVSQSGQIKIGNCFSWPNQISNYQKTLNQKQITYLSPEELQMCKNQKMDSLINLVISESFSIGLTMLHAGQKIQNWMQLQFHNQQDNSKISYSPALKQIVKDLCTIDPYKRESSMQIYKILQPFKEQILNIQNFQLNYKKYNKREQVKNNFVPESLKGLASSSELKLYNYQSFVPVNNYQDTKYQNQFLGIQNPAWNKKILTPPTLTKQFNQKIQNNSQQHYNLYNKYSNSKNVLSNTNYQSSYPISNTNNYSNFQQKYQIKPIINYQQIYQSNQKILTKPFQIKNQNQMIRYSNTTNIIRVQNKIDKKIQKYQFPTTYVYSTPQIKEFTTEINKTQQWKGNPSSSHDYTQFLRKIDQQIQKSKSLFPS